MGGAKNGILIIKKHWGRFDNRSNDDGGGTMRICFLLQNQTAPPAASPSLEEQVMLLPDLPSPEPSPREADCRNRTLTEGPVEASGATRAHAVLFQGCQSLVLKRVRGGKKIIPTFPSGGRSFSKVRTFTRSLSRRPRKLKDAKLVHSLPLMMILWLGGLQ